MIMLQKWFTSHSIPFTQSPYLMIRPSWLMSLSQQDHCLSKLLGYQECQQSHWGHTVLTVSLDYTWQLLVKIKWHNRVVIVSSIYGKFVFYFLVFKAEEDADRKKVYDTANFYHFVHTLALLGVPLTKRPVLVSSTNDNIMQSSMKLLNVHQMLDLI